MPQKSPSFNVGVTRIAAWSGVAVFATLACVLLAGENSPYLIKVEELSLFIPDMHYFRECMAVPGGFLMWLSTFLTQFFYYPWLGSCLMIVLLVALWLLTYRSLKFPKTVFLIASLPSMMLLLTFLSAGYLIFTVKTAGFAYNAIVGLLFSLTAYLVFSLHNGNVWRFCVLTAIALTYPLFGFYSLLAASICLVKAIASKPRNILLMIIGIILIVGVPQIVYYFSGAHLMRSQLYTSGLPRYGVAGNDQMIPYIVCFCFLVLSVAFCDCIKKIKADSRCALIVSAVFFLGMSATLYFGSYRDANFSAFLKMDQAIDRGDYAGALQSAKNLDVPPTRTVTLFTHLALFNLGQAGDSVFAYPISDAEYNSPLPDIALRMTCSRNLLYRLGRINDCYRWSMEDMVEYGQKVEYLKYLSKCALLNGETRLARRYLNLLSKTMFHKKWAEKYLDYADHLEKMDNDPEFAAIRPLMAYNDHIGGDAGMIESYLSATLSAMAGGPPPLVELSLQFNLMRKDIAGFWPRFILYANSHDTLPRHYQEAAILFSTLERQIDWRQFDIDNDVAAKFEDFMEMARQNSGLPDAANLEYFKPRFGDTYWYYYFFVKNLKTS